MFLRGPASKKTSLAMFDWLPKQKKHRLLRCFFGGGKRDRTADLLNAIQTLSQLSYTPIITYNNERLFKRLEYLNCSAVATAPLFNQGSQDVTDKNNTSVVFT